MEFKKGEFYKHTIKGGSWDVSKMEKKDDVREIEVLKIIRRNGKTFVKVFCHYGFGYSIVVEEIINNKNHSFEKMNK